MNPWTLYPLGGLLLALVYLANKNWTAIRILVMFPAHWLDARRSSRLRKLEAENLELRATLREAAESIAQAHRAAKALRETFLREAYVARREKDCSIEAITRDIERGMAG